MHGDLISLGLALGMGLLVGFERERHADTVAGVRTFGFAGFIGGLGALLTPQGSTPWVLVAVAVLLGAVTAYGGMFAAGRAVAAEEPNGDSRRESYGDIGLTTAFAVIATTLLGGYAVLGDRSIAVAAAGVLFLLLYIRDPLHALIRRLGQEDVRAIATFVLIALVILPVLPNTPMGPLNAINPRGAWTIVVLVVAISLAGYLAQVLIGPRAGTLASGIFGGIVSSTAATVGAARRAREEGAVPMSAAVILLACGVLPIRLIALIGVASPAVLKVLWPWLAGAAAITLLGGLASLRRTASMGPDATALPMPRNPTQLKSALAFAALFVAVRVATKAAVGATGMGVFFVVAAVSGVTDMDAIALSSAREAVEGLLTPADAARGTLIAFAVNTAFKLGVARMAGSRALLDSVLPGLVAAGVIAIAGVWVIGSGVAS